LTRKLLFVVNVDFFFISHRLPIAMRALQQGYEVHIATGLTNGLEELQSRGLIVHPLSLDRRSMGIFSNVLTFFQILRVFLKLRPDVVHLVSIKPVLLGGIAARLAAIPCVVAAISGLGFVFISHGFKATVRRTFIGWFYRLALSHKNLKAIFQNEDDLAILSDISNLPNEKANLIRGSGVDLTLYSPSPLREGVPNVVLAARLYAEKGVREFVEAARTLKSVGSNANFVIVGEPDQDNPAAISTNELNQWTSEGVIEWWGHRNDIPEVFANSFIVVLPSYREGFSKVLTEAAACGRAVITSDVPGCRDAIEPGVTGLLVPMRDIKALAAAIRFLLDNPSLCEEMGRAGRKLAECSFDIQKVVSQHMLIYDELLQHTNS
jgi:glycosyltransferase involved in cell wall biosynthesis